MLELCTDSYRVSSGKSCFWQRGLWCIYRTGSYIQLKAKYQSLSNRYLSILQGGYRLTYLKVASSPVASNNSLGKRNDLAYCIAEP